MVIALVGTPFLTSSAATAWARRLTGLGYIRRAGGIGVAVNLDPRVLDERRIIGGFLDDLAGAVCQGRLVPSKNTRYERVGAGAGAAAGAGGGGGGGWLKL